MLSIGQFSRACCVSVKTLRHYEKVGLLMPARVDSWSGYRYYEESQIPSMLLIQRLKRYGMSLVEIGRVLACPEKGREALIRQRAALEALMEQTAQTLGELNRHLENIERTGLIMSYQDQYEISISNEPPRWILSSRQKMSVEDFGLFYGRLYERVARERLAVDGTTMAIYHDEAFNQACTDIELALGVTRQEDATRALPGGLMAVTTHRGAYASLSDAYGALTRWIARNGYRQAGAPYEIYRKNQFDHLPPEAWETDIFFPVEKAE